MCFVGFCLSCVSKSYVIHNMDTDLNAVNEKQLQLEETGESSRVDLNEIIPHTGDTAGSSTTDCVRGNSLNYEDGGVDPSDLKQESHDVCCILYHTFLVCSITKKDFLHTTHC